MWDNKDKTDAAANLHTERERDNVMATDRELLEQILGKVTSLGTDVSSLKEDVSTLKTEVSSLKEDVSSLKEDVSTLKTEVSSLKEDVSSLKEDVSFLKEKTDKLDLKIDTLDFKVDRNYDLTLEFYGNQKEHNTEVSDTLITISGELEMHNNQIAKNTAALKRYK